MALGRWPDEKVAWLLDGMLGDPGLAYLVSGLSPYLPQGFPPQTREDNGCLRGSDGLQQAGQGGHSPLDLEFVAALLICGFVCWGGAAWIDRR
jgi:hypothetical protein